MNREQDLQECYQDISRLIDENSGPVTMDEMLEATDWCPIHRDAIENMLNSKAIYVINSCTPYHYFRAPNWRFKVKQFDEDQIPAKIDDVVELGED